MAYFPRTYNIADSPKWRRRAASAESISSLKRRGTNTQEGSTGDGALSRGRLETPQHVQTAGRTFGSGSGLVHHARDKRVRGRGCRDFWLAQHDIDSDLADRQEEQDLTLLRAARKKGRSHAIASRPARRHDGKLSLAGLRDELVLHIACPVQCSFFLLDGVCLALRLRVTMRRRKKDCRNSQRNSDKNDTSSNKS